MDKICLTRQGQALGGATPRQLLDSRVILWAGHCSVHKLFRPEHCDQVRAADAAGGTGVPPVPGPPTTILVHPECCKEVVDKADLSGSTEFIIKAIREAKPGSRWAIGTEVHLVTRLAREAKERGVHVRILSDCQCLCTTMYRIDLFAIARLRVPPPCSAPPRSPVNDAQPRRFVAHTLARFRASLW